MGTPAPYDELIDVQDHPRPGWAPVWAYLNIKSSRELRYADEQVQRELSEQEITGSVHDAEDGTQRGWQLDSIPFVLDQNEWRGLRSALSQRAQTLEAILQDLYGERRLLAQPWFPQQLLYEHPGYLRPMVGAVGQRFLHSYAADLVRDADGAWRVLVDRCQAPYGLGYALQNRLVLGRSLPSLFKQTQVRTLAPFFQEYLDELTRQSGKSEPRMVLFGSQAYNETIYEQAFLARYLDIDFVLADDLTVRGGQVWLKTLGGLEPIDVILRFVDDRLTDPLNLRPDSIAGVPGLVDVVRDGGVIVANRLGSGVVDSPGFMPYLDRCAEALGLAGLGVPSVPSRWCGIPGTVDEVEAEPERSVLLNAWFGLRQEPLFPAGRLADDVVRQWHERLRQRPAGFAAVDKMQPSMAPAWDTGLLQHHAVVLRMFLVAKPDGDFTCLPGGLVRSASDPAFAYYGIRHGGTSKDVWIPTDDAVKAAPTPIIPEHRHATVRRALDLPSSRLDDLFWFGRTCEGLDHLARMLRAMVMVERGRIVGEREQGLPFLDDLCDYYCHTDANLESQQRLADIVFAAAPAMSIQTNVDELGRLARNARAYLSGDTWMQVQELRRQLKRMGINREAPFGSLARVARLVITAANALAGTIAENMVRDPAWQFVDLGRRLQRAMMIGRLVHQSAQTAGHDLLVALDVADSAVTWRARHGALPDADGVSGLLLDDEKNPRSVMYQLVAVENILRDMPGTEVIGDPLLHLVETARVAIDGRDCLNLNDALSTLAQLVDHRWFSHALPRQSVDRSQEVL